LKKSSPDIALLLPFRYAKERQTAARDGTKRNRKIGRSVLPRCPIKQHPAPGGKGLTVVVLPGTSLAGGVVVRPEPLLQKRAARRAGRADEVRSLTRHDVTDGPRREFMTSVLGRELGLE
jgi:hypothetical protein